MYIHMCIHIYVYIYRYKHTSINAAVVRIPHTYRVHRNEYHIPSYIPVKIFSHHVLPKEAAHCVQKSVGEGEQKIRTLKTTCMT